MTTRSVLCVIFAGLSASFTLVQPANRVTLTLDSSEAEAVLAILDKRALQQSVTDADWQRLFTTTPYRRLKQGEASMGQPFTDEEFIEFVATLDARREQLRRSLTQWQSIDARAVGQRPLAYLPPQARIRADVYPVIKARSNSYAFEPYTAPAIFLYLDPEKTRAQLEDTFAHEAHHLALAGVQAAYEEKIQSLPESARQAAHWMGAFREGMAVLAAAGSPDIHPLADFSESSRFVWDLEDKRFPANLDELNQFFLDTVHRNLLNDAITHEGRVFFRFGDGPWYTVGYRMAVTIEREFGHAALVATYVDPRQFVARYNEAAASENAKNGGHLHLFSAEILEAVDGEPR